MKWLTDRLYKFFSLACGSIAHYDIHGWINEYPTTQDVRSFLLKNEFGVCVLNGTPPRRADVRRILEWAFTLFNIQDDERRY